MSSRTRHTRANNEIKFKNAERENTNFTKKPLSNKTLPPDICRGHTYPVFSVLWAFASSVQRHLPARNTSHVRVVSDPVTPNLLPQP